MKAVLASVDGEQGLREQASKGVQRLPEGAIQVASSKKIEASNSTHLGAYCRTPRQIFKLTLHQTTFLSGTMHLRVQKELSMRLEYTMAKLPFLQTIPTSHRRL